MTPQVRRIVVPIIVGAIAVAIVAFVAFSRNVARSNAATAPQSDSAPVETPAASADDAAEPVDDAAASADDAAPETDPVPAGPRPELDGLRAVAPAGGMIDPAVPAVPIGSLDPERHRMEIRFDRAGAGIARIAFADLWETAAARRAAADHRRDSTQPAPDESLRYVLMETRRLVNGRLPLGVEVPALAPNQVVIDGVAVPLLKQTGPDGLPTGGAIWTELEPGAFATEVVNADGERLLRIERRFRLGAGYDVTLEQRVENLTAATLDIGWWQFGPGDLRVDRTKYMDRRRFRFGYLIAPERDPSRSLVFSENDQLLERQKVAKSDEPTLWPNRHSESSGQELSWFAATNRYFALCVHPFVDASGVGSRSFTDVVERVVHEESFGPESDQPIAIFTYLQAPTRAVAPGATRVIDMGVYAGPLDRHVLGQDHPYADLNMAALIRYQMSSMCAFCTFQWLAKALLGFLTLLRTHVVFDWGIAIIGLVVVVRTLLHPITKRSQIGMQRFGRQMQKLKPELDKLQKKFPGDQKRIQQEQMRLMREHGINPFQMLGCLPMFLQTPIWIALYAMLYFAFDLRQQPAFFGVFQELTGGSWSFLGDLSAADHFLWEFAEPRSFLLWNLTGINALPILMGVIFFIQQKYMTPPPSPSMTEDQIRQQKMMKYIFLFMFPLMLYSAPSGLTLYILTSSSIGILESRYVRNHIDQLDLEPKRQTAEPAGPRSKPRDALARAYAARMKHMEQKRREKSEKDARRFKKRK